MKNVLFVSPYMERTGSEMMVLFLANKLHSFNRAVFSLKNGSLLKELNEKVAVKVNPLNRKLNIYYDFARRKIGCVSLLEKEFIKTVKEFKPDLIIVNTLGFSELIPSLKKTSVPFAVHVHELPSSFDLLTADDFNFILQNARFFIACSNDVKTNLEKAGAQRVYLFHECIDIAQINLENLNNSEKPEFLKSFSSVFAMSGQLGYRKGVHLLPEISKKLTEFNACLIWIGKNRQYGLSELIQKQLSSLETHNIFFIGEQTTEYYKWLNFSDAFTLLSIEDPYPLVMIEAAYLRKPIFSFNSGGASEFIQADMGEVIPLIDMAKFINSLKEFSNGTKTYDLELLHQVAINHDINARISDYEKIIENEIGYK